MTRIPNESSRQGGPFAVEPLTLPFDLELAMPGSKSHANRALIAAALAPGRTRITHATPCEDVVFMVENLRRMGFDLAWEDEASGTIVVQGGIRPLAKQDQEVELYCGNAGTTLRFLFSLAVRVPGVWRLDGGARMRERPIAALTSAWRGLGVEVEDTGGYPPVRVRGGHDRGGSVRLDASVSSQYLSSMLLVGASLTEGLEVRLDDPPASASYLDITRRVIADFGGETRAEPGVFATLARPLRAAGDYAIEGDWSAAGAFSVLAELTRSVFRPTNLDPESDQGDRRLDEVIAAMRGAGDRSIDCGNLPDQLMNICVLAAARSGRTTLTGAAHLRIKECDRLAVIRRELRKCGVNIEERDDGVVVTGPSELRPAIFDPEGDHRMAMAFAILGSISPGLRIDDASCVGKSYPRFFDDLARLREAPRCLALVGLRAVGKSTLAAASSRRLGLAAVDTDERFVAAEGEIAAFVAERGWAEFRKVEARIVAESLRPGRVVALGGGAIETAEVRDRLRREAIVIWVRESRATMLARLAADGGQRPPLTDASLEDELDQLVAERTPILRDLADVVLPEGGTDDERIQSILETLEPGCSS